MTNILLAFIAGGLAVHIFFSHGFNSEQDSRSHYSSMYYTVGFMLLSALVFYGLAYGLSNLLE